MTPAEIVRAYWSAMGSNDFAAAAEWLTEDVQVSWPQSGEVILGRANFAAINTAYPANGPWAFEIRRLVAEGAEVVTDVAVTDGVIQAVAVTFHEIRDGLIARQVEYWPDPYEAPAWRAQWVRLGPEGAARTRLT